MPANVRIVNFRFVKPFEYFMQVDQTTSKIPAMNNSIHAIENFPLIKIIAFARASSKA